MSQKRKYNSYRDHRSKFKGGSNGQGPAKRQNICEEHEYSFKSEEDLKIERFIKKIQDQRGIRGKIVFLESEIENPAVILQNAIDFVKSRLKCEYDEKLKEYVFSIDNEVFASGVYTNKQAAKSTLAQKTLDVLKKDCFYIVKRRNYEEVHNDSFGKNQPTQNEGNTLEGSKAHQMMLKMGWGGKGLGAKEQGLESAVTLYENITREGLGSNSVMNGVDRILREYANSTKITTLAFDPEFNKDERAIIHKIAHKYNLKTKSEGKESRRITISKKISRYDIVRELLRLGGENQSYTLRIPENYEKFWTFPSIETV